MSDAGDRHGGQWDSHGQDEERPLRWAPEESSQQPEPTAPLFGGEPPGGSGEPPPPPPLPALPSWERLEEEGFFRALFLTIKEVLSEPVETFARMPREPVLGRPLLFYVIFGTMAAVVSALYNMAWGGISPSGQAEFQELYDRFSQFMEISPDALEMILFLSPLVAIVLAPFLIIIKAFIWSGVVHLLLMLFGGANHGYETTFRTLCYVLGATAVFAFIPVCGQFPIGWIWGIVCSIIGLTQSHETSSGKAAAAVLVPYLFCCFCIGVGMIMMGLAFLPDLLSAVW